MSAVWTETEVVPFDRERKIERETHKLEKRLCRLVGQAIMEYNLIEEGDKVMVCLSGGKVISRSPWTDNEASARL